MREESSWPWREEGLRADPEVGLSAVNYFHRMKDPRALPLLEEAFGGSVRFRCAVVEALGGIGDSRAVPFLKRVLEEDESQAVRSRVARALGAIGDPSATRALVRASRQEKNRTGRGKTVQNAVESALQKTADSGSLDDLVGALRDRNASTRVAAARALARLQDPGAAEPLARALLTDGQDEVRSWAAQGLSDLQGGIARSALIEALDRESVADLRRTVVLCLHKHRHPETVEALAEVVRRDRDPRVRMEAVKAIAGMGDLGRRRADALRYAADNDAVPYNRKTAASYLRQLGW
jgi:HEAT repeat protein